ncbi:MAG: thiol-disulfide oxidoreductase DCC family protein [bacterium]|nr:thiol-disulfide oxidoreductase DCC family protein [bacterium]
MNSQQIVVFDGSCHVCSYAVRFIIKRDRRAVYTFTPMQSDYGRKLLSKYGIHPENLDTFVLVKGDTPYLRSDAAIEIVRRFEGVWKILVLCKFIPKPLRDAVYSLIAKNRYRLFGQKDACMIATDEIKERFIE